LLLFLFVKVHVLALHASTVQYILWYVDPLLCNSHCLHVGILTDTNATMAQQQTNGVFCAVYAEMLQAGQVSGQNQSVEWVSWITAGVQLVWDVAVSSW
jgi:hypothetical protein